MSEPKHEAGRKPPALRETLFLCALCIIPGLVLVLIGAGVVSGNVTAGAAGRLLALAAGMVFIFGGVMVFLRDTAGVRNNENIPANAPLWIRAGESFVGIATIAAFACVCSVIAFGPFFSGDMLPDMVRQMGSFGSGLFRPINGIFALIFWYIAAYLTYDKFRKRGGETQAK